MDMDTYWLCDTCGGKINSPGEGLVEWYTFNDDEGVIRHGNFRLVHEISASPLKKMNLKRKGCEFDLRAARIKVEGAIENQPLAIFLGPDGLMRLLSFIADGNFPVAEVLRMIKRLHVPGFEMARDFFAAAASEGVIRQGTPDTYHDQGDINAVLQWLKARRG
jgi:hypothetical protein